MSNTNMSRLILAGQKAEVSKQELRTKVDELLTWIRDNIKVNSLPCNCTFYFPNMLVRTALSNPPNGTHVTIMSLHIGNEHTLDSLNEFVKLIDDGFIDQLIEGIEQQNSSYQRASKKIGSFLKPR